MLKEGFCNTTETEEHQSHLNWDGSQEMKASGNILYLSDRIQEKNLNKIKMWLVLSNI